MYDVLSGLYLGQSATISRTFTKEDMMKCADLTNDFNPIYFSEEFVVDTRFKNPIVQGILTEGLIISAISNHLPGPGCVLLQKELVFLAPVYCGDEINAYIEVIDIDRDRNWITERVICKNQSSQEVVRGQVLLLVEKRVSG
jgi:3-hydroxybutyryl-CoA dehydratase